MSDQHWWRNAVVYEIYPRSFADSNGDGIGDLGGIREKLPYLADLGVDALWLTPFYPSPLADGGYDISDHCDVDPRLGSLADFDDLVRRAHALGMKILVDIVPNHTSDQHPWFRSALAAEPGSRARERYIFRDGAGPDGRQPPSDWRSHFGGGGWEQVADGQWYLHLFAREQPDLNWDDTEVRRAYLGILRFWADRGVDGFRIDVAHALAKDLSEPLRSQPSLDAVLPTDGSDPLYDRDEVHAIYREWRSLFDTYDPPRAAVAETWTPISERTYLYARPSELGQVFDFSLLKSPWDAGEFGSIIRRCVAGHAGHGGGLTWVLSSHDVVRPASRLALPADLSPDAWLMRNGSRPPLDPTVGQRRARAAALLMLALPGSAYLYQGEELGLPEVADLEPDVLHDPVWARTGYQIKGRDGCRVPLPWDATAANFGFSPHHPWLPQPDWFGQYAADSQDGLAESCLTMYRRAIALRRGLQIGDSDLAWLSPEWPDVIHFRRSNGWECITNFGPQPYPMPSGRVVLTSAGESPFVLETDSSAWIVPDLA